MASTPTEAPRTRGFFTTPSWTRSAIAMSLFLGVAGTVLGAMLVMLEVAGRVLHVPTLVVGIVTITASVAGLTTGLRGVRAWQREEPMPASWYWPGAAAGVIQGAAFSGGLVLDYFLGGGPMSAAPAWIIALTMLSLGGIPFLGALCCAGAWWTARDPSAAPVPSS